jgi:hypothetical protein
MKIQIFHHAKKKNLIFKKKIPQIETKNPSIYHNSIYNLFQVPTQAPKKLSSFKNPHIKKIRP